MFKLAYLCWRACFFCIRVRVFIFFFYLIEKKQTLFSAPPPPPPQGASSTRSSGAPCPLAWSPARRPARASTASCPPRWATPLGHSTPLHSGKEGRIASNRRSVPQHEHSAANQAVHRMQVRRTTIWHCWNVPLHSEARYISGTDPGAFRFDPELTAAKMEVDVSGRSNTQYHG